jgi:AraC-like DNA-binding protein/mannose-6-phosphate isomerase-like protein (cupin superfamily)
MEFVMRNSKRYSELSSGLQKPDGETSRQSVLEARATARRVHVPKKSCKDHFSLVEPQINADGVHVWPFDVSCPVDVLFLTEDGRHNVRMNRHGYFEVLYFCSGSADCHIQDRLLPVGEGDLAIIGSTIYHRVQCRSSSPFTIAALFFEPDLIRCDGGSDSAEYLTPFLLQDPEFPHVVPAETGIPNQVLELMLRIRSELPPKSPRGRLAIKTYLKMILILLVNRYASYAGTVETFQRQQRALDTLLPLFRYLSEQRGSVIQVREAARICGMSESHFMSFFKRVTGLSFIKYLNHYRIECSQALLANTDESMASISQEMGFCDQSYFGAVFHRLVGMTPAAYRRRFRNKEATDRRQMDHTPPITSRGLSLTGTSGRSTAEINRQLASGHAKSRIDQFGT